MSAKCNFSLIYKPLVEEKRRSLDNDAFQNWVNETFLNPDAALVSTHRLTALVSQFDINARRLAEAPQEVDSIQTYFANNSVGYQRLISNFSKSIIESAIYNYYNSQWIDAEAKINDSGLTQLNKNIFDYKLRLLNTILNDKNINVTFNTSDLDINDSDIDIKLTNAIADAIQNVELALDKVSSSTYEAYVILKNFNRLIAEKAPFIELRAEYENTGAHGVNMYTYKGPNVKHRVSWTVDEHISAESQYSDLSKILLNYFPEYTNEQPIPNTSIGVDGFISVVKRFKTALMYSTDESLKKHRIAYLSGNGFNIREALNDYLEFCKRYNHFTGGNKSQFTSRIYKLEGIIHYIYDGNLDDDVKEMFTAMINKTVDLQYVGYDTKNGRFGAMVLNDRDVNTYSLRLRDIVNARIRQFRSNPELLKTILDNYGIKVNLAKRNGEYSYIEIKSPINKNKQIIIDHFEPDTKGFTKFNVNINDRNAFAEVILPLVQDLLGMKIPGEIGNLADILTSGHGIDYIIDSFKDIASLVLIGSDPNINNAIFPPYNGTKGNLDFRQWFLYRNFDTAGELLAILNGAEMRNVVDDVNGHQLPTNGLTSLVFNAPKMAYEMGKYDDNNKFGYKNIFGANPCVLDEERNVPIFGTPKIRSGIKIGDQVKKIPDLTLGELLEVALTYDFLPSIELGTFSGQNANTADKERQFIIDYQLGTITIPDGKTYNVKQLVIDSMKGIASAQNELAELWTELRKYRYNAIEYNLIEDYRAGFANVEALKKLGIKVKSVFTGNNYADLQKYLDENKLTYDQVHDALRAAGRNVTDEITVVEGNNGKAELNKVLVHLTNTFQNPKMAKRRLAKSRAYFALDMFNSRLKLNRFTNSEIADKWDSISDDWKEKRGDYKTGNVILFKVFDKAGNEIKINSTNAGLITNPENTVVLNPFIETYLLCDIIYSNEFNQMLVGDPFGHSGKVKGIVPDTDNGYESTDLLDALEAAKTVSQNKRAVIYGGSIHAFQHDLKDNRGVAKQINVAVMKDIKAAVWNLVGGLSEKEIDDFIDSSDGAGLQSIYEAILEQESLKDAAGGVDEKTILGWNDKYTGQQILLKWAVYALTKERRRMGTLSKVSIERLFQKMHSFEIPVSLDIQALWNNHVGNEKMYIHDWKTGKYYEVLGIQKIQNNGYARQVREVDRNGILIEDAPVLFATNKGEIKQQILPEDVENDCVYNTLYSLDQLFGGAWEMSMQNGRLEYTNRGDHIVTDIICENNLKDYFIAYTVNKSAVKTGAQNVNKADAWETDQPLDYMQMSTEYGGLQMNAEHELDDSVVSEMTQMISALMEKGFSKEFVDQIYNDIGDVIVNALSKVKKAIVTNPDDLKTIFGKALIEAYAAGNRDTLGLAQSFLIKAEKMLKEKDIKFKFPFSAASIYGSFISTVSSMLTKSGIRRKYSGIAAVLTPSYNMIQVFGNGKLFTQHAEWLLKWKLENSAYENWTIEDLINLHEKDGIRNPFIEENPDFKFEDTIIVERKLTDENGKPILNEDGTEVWVLDPTPIVIDSFAKFDKYHDPIYKRDNNIGKVYVWKSKPRNLRGQDMTMELVNRVDNPKEYLNVKGTKKISIYQTSIVRAANYANLKNPSKNQLDVIFYALRHFGNAAEGKFRDAFIIKDNEGFLKAMQNQDYVLLKQSLDVKRTFYNLVDAAIRAIKNDGILYDPLYGDIYVRNVEVEAAEIVMGKLFANKFLLQKGDDVSEILEQGPKFFESRLRGKYYLPEQFGDKYDAVIYTENNDAVLVKVDPNLNFGEGQAPNYNITKVDGKAYLNQKPFTDAEGKQFYSVKDDNGNFYDVVVVKTIEDFYDLTKEQSISQFRINYKSKMALDLSIAVADDDEIIDALESKAFTRDAIVARLQEIEEHEFNKRIVNQARLMAKSFRASLNMVGTRIPAQAMQSFQYMKVVAFTDSETNDVYVNRHNTYIEGSDYDIDKTYILAYDVNDDGIIDTGTKLARVFDVDAAFELELAKGRHFDEATTASDNVFIVSNNTLRTILRGLKPGGAYATDLERVAELNKILRSGKTELQFTPIIKQENESQNDFIRRERNWKSMQNRLIKMLNSHESSYISDAALKNRVTHGIMKVASDPLNFSSFTSPVSTDAQEAVANESAIGKAEQHINVDIPSAKYMMQEQNMTGKQGIGITAVSIKCYFAKSAEISTFVNSIPEYLKLGRDDVILNILKHICFKNPLTGRLTILANVNLLDTLENLSRTHLDIAAEKPIGSDVIPDLTQFNDPSNGGKFNLQACLRWLKAENSRVNAAAQLSGILSSATDNAKLLVLRKINATTAFIDLYTVAIQSGCTFEEAADIIASPIFTAVSRLMDKNIFKSYMFYPSLSNAIKFYLGETDAMLPDFGQFIKRRIARALNREYSTLSSKDINDYLLNNDNVNALLDSAYADLNKNTKSYNADYFDESDFDESRNYATKESILREIEFLENCIERNDILTSMKENAPSQLNKLKIVLEKFIPMSEEQNVLGQLLGANQGLRTSGYEQYSLINRVEKFVSEKLHQDFDLIKFLTDDVYQQDMINAYESVKSGINILSVIKVVPHFREMIKLVADNDFILRHLSERYNVTQNIAKRLSKENRDKTLRESEYRQIGYYVNDLFIISFLSNSGATINIPPGIQFYTVDDRPKTSVEYTPIKFDTLYGLASFKSYMETYLIPLLKEKYNGNPFVDSLIYTEREFRDGSIKTQYRLPLNMLTIDFNTSTKEEYNQILNGFNELSNTTVGGWKISDLFFIYDMIVNKNSIGQSSLVRLFEDLIDSEKSSSMPVAFFDYIAEIDSNPDARASFENSIRDNDVKNYIKRSVPKGSIKHELEPFPTKDPNFTFPVNSLVATWNFSKSEVKPYDGKISAYSYNISSKQAITELIQQLPIPEGLIETHDTEWFIDNFKDDKLAQTEPAFIHNGVIYINIGKANVTDVLHEYTHVVLAAMKYNKNANTKNLYYKLLDSVKNHPNYELIAAPYREMGVIGTDLQEEVFAKILQQFFMNNIRQSTTTDILESNKNTITETLKEILGIDSDAKLDLNTAMMSRPAVILKVFSSKLFNLDEDTQLSGDAIIWRIKTQALRQRYIEENRVEVNCD